MCHLCLWTRRIFEVSVDRLLRIQVVGLKQEEGQKTNQKRGKQWDFLTDLQESDSLVTTSAREADEVDDSFL